MTSSDIEVVSEPEELEREEASSPQLTARSSHLDLAGDQDKTSAANSDIESTCTVVLASALTATTTAIHNNNKVHEFRPAAEGEADEEQILSAQKLLLNKRIQPDAAAAAHEDAERSLDSSVCCVEIDLRQAETSTDNINIKSRQQSSALINTNENLNQQRGMFSSSSFEHHQHPSYSSTYMMNSPEQPASSSRNHHYNLTLKDSSPKLSFSSWRMREYFESFQSHSRDTKNLYQFFKSIRTELVASLLFALISSHSLILCRIHLEAPYYDTHSKAAAATTTVDGRLLVQLISGLVVCLLVASLTQVFGHVSGCHLIPSVSLALFIKGHIGRARLASYLAAQAIGALLGICLLALLTSSQLPASSLLASSSPLPPDKSPSHANLVDHQNIRQLRPDDGRVVNWGQLPPPPPPLHSTLQQPVGRRKREAVQGDGDIDLNDIQGSETILLSIMEQQQQERTKAATANATATATATNEKKESKKTLLVEEGEEERRKLEATMNLAPVGQEKTITLSGTPIASTQTDLSSALSLSSPLASRPDLDRSYLVLAPSGVGATFKEVVPVAERATASSKEGGASNSYGSNNNNSSGVSNDESRVSHSYPTTKTTTTTTTTTTTDRSISSIVALEAISKNSHYSSPTKQLLSSSSPMGTKVKRTKRNKQKQPNHLAANTEVNADRASNQETITLNDNSNENGEPVTSNMLALGLPEPIMSADSIRQCSLSQPISKRKQLLFLNCLSLSNASQMFVFQLLACSLVVLVYLVNVDPRRTDAGFKSLSIGFGYFVANGLTINSGGFFGNPFQLMALSWFSTSSSLDFLPAAPMGWRSEWWIYLITPLIGGLFGAISHEYIDYTSPGSRSRPLHLRRSFHSIHSVASLADLNNSQAQGDGIDLATVELANQKYKQKQQQQQRNQRTTRRGSDSSCSAGVASSDSLSTCLDPTGDEQLHHEQQQQREQLEQLERGRKLEVASNANGCYSRQLSRENQRLRKEQQQQQLKDCRPVAAARRASDFDANFLISSSSCSSSPLQLPPQQSIHPVRQSQSQSQNRSRSHSNNTNNSIGSQQRPLACCSRANQMMMSTSVM